MTRFDYYLISFGISCLLLLGSLILNSPILTTLIVILFFLSSILYNFSFTSERAVRHLDEPQVHYYRSSRANTYTYFTVLSFVLIAMLFYVLTFSLKINSGLSAIILWLFYCIIESFIRKAAAQSHFVEQLGDYIVRNITLSKAVQAKLNLIVVLLLEDTTQKEILTLIPELSAAELRKIRQTAKFYLAEINKADLLSDEIAELNDL